MGRFLIGTTIVMAAWLGTVAVAQSKITTVEEYAKLMKSNAQAMGATNKAIASMAYADARTQLTTLRQNFVLLEGFWAQRKRDDAVGLVKTGLTNLDALDKMLAAPTVDQMTAQAAAKTFQGACGGCHKTYREGTQETGFKFREGVF
jgi:cytochrome c556